MSIIAYPITRNPSVCYIVFRSFRIHGRSALLTLCDEIHNVKMTNINVMTWQLLLGDTCVLSNTHHHHIYLSLFRHEYRIELLYGSRGDIPYIRYHKICIYNIYVIYIVYIMGKCIFRH